jgi:hypothetical protein
MDNTIKQQICVLRGGGASYSQIADGLGISVNTVKSFCKRNDLGGRAKPGKELVPITDAATACRNCGVPLSQASGVKPRKFCAPACRQAWGAAHPDAIQQRATYFFDCNGCGQPFTAYGNTARKYCSHACYITTRFDKGLAVAA